MVFYADDINILITDKDENGLKEKITPFDELSRKLV
jgi:hypothetical protein